MGQGRHPLSENVDFSAHDLLSKIGYVGQLLVEDGGDFLLVLLLIDIRSVDDLSAGSLRHIDGMSDLGENPRVHLYNVSTPSLHYSVGHLDCQYVVELPDMRHGVFPC